MYEPETERWHAPKEGGDGITQSPGDRPLTAEPTECTSPTPSYPPTAGSGGLTGYTPTSRNYSVQNFV